MNLSKMDNKKLIGSRLIEAFETDDKAFIAEKLGFSSVQGVYKVLSGERELDFEKLQRFRNYTKCSIDWLLTGEGPKVLEAFRAFDVEKSIERHDDWRDVIDEWYQFEGRSAPDTIGASFMGGWRKFNPEERLAAIKDYKMVLDRLMEKEG